MNMSLVELREERVEADAAFAAAVEAVENAAEDADTEALKASLDAADERFTLAKDNLKAAEKREADARARFELERRAEDSRRRLEGAAQDTLNVSVKSEPLTYTRHGEFGFFHDLFARDIMKDQDAADRLARHRNEMAVERAAKYDLSSTDSAGGYLVAPLWLNEQFVDLARAGRVVTDAIGTRPLPPNTDSINLPTMSTGTSVADQADNASVSETDAVFSTVAGAVKTISGLQDVALQLVDRSIPGVDEVIFADLTKAYNVSLDTAVINSATASNLGLLQVSGINAVTYTDATPTLGELYSKIADAVQQVHSNIFLPADAIFMHPRRWGWCLAAVDGSNRPLVVPTANNPQNAAGTQAGVVAEGLVGTIQGLPVYVDANIPTTLGASTTEDVIIVARRDECFVYEDQSGPYLRTFEDVGSGTNTVRFRLHNYWAQINARRPKAISKITGTGVIAPTF